ncbi:MAG: tail fiber domain-containing protein [Chitinophagaceae bacterium]|nr:tail fiber domain-containing protein [Chitinophagaceae bacterium]
MGWQTTASGSNSTAMGSSTTASGSNSTAMGWLTTASGFNSTAMGQGTIASGQISTAMGHDTKAQGATSTAMGYGTSALGLTSTAMGWQATAMGESSTAMGQGTIAEAKYSLAIGRYNLIQNLPPNALPLPGDKVFQIGNGISANIRSDAFFVRRNGNAELAGTLKENSDIRLKKDVLPLEKVMGKIAHIQPITYNFINTQTHPGEHQIGFSAQEVQQQFPELVSENEQGYLSVAITT